MSQSAQVLPSRLLILLLALASLFLLFSARVEADQPLRVEEHVVESGDTVWEVAATLTPEGESVRQTISLIRDLNPDLQPGALRPGSTILVPAS